MKYNSYDICLLKTTVPVIFNPFFPLPASTMARMTGQCYNMERSLITEWPCGSLESNKHTQYASVQTGRLYCVTALGWRVLSPMAANVTLTEAEAETHAQEGKMTKFVTHNFLHTKSFPSWFYGKGHALCPTESLSIPTIVSFSCSFSFLFNICH